MKHYFVVVSEYVCRQSFTMEAKSSKGEPCLSGTLTGPVKLMTEVGITTLEFFKNWHILKT